ncbi:hypothetical protein CspeluHIS016_0309460 [Cutaneotrichosporon spelunceum]|uniref:Uncharacterized protein n=1 Tax=Cutaneotrichosporon spelunceum TaxID=1672016 RepID=A0AAD3TV50_9TREE|nr:hypothetical protein CspeluHIS016_0309460 [Cutaneotrichosporon spelunceum]
MKRSDIHHVTFHIQKAAVLLSVPESTTLASLRSQLVPALAALGDGALPTRPGSADDIQLWEDREVQGAEGGAGARHTIRDEDGSFGEPSYTIPDPMDGDEE